MIFFFCIDEIHPHRSNFEEDYFTVRILLLGATGRVGSKLLTLALADGHQVTAFVRDENKLKTNHPAMKTFIGNTLNKEDIVAAMPNHDIVISAMGTDGKETLSESMPYIVEAMIDNGMKRIITIGTAGILKSRQSPELYRFQSSETKRRSPKATRASEDHRSAYETLTISSLDWTVVCPTYLPDGEEIGTYRCEVDFLPVNGERISVPDTAMFAYNQIAATQYLKCRVGLAY